MCIRDSPEVVAGIIEYLQEYGFYNVIMMEGSWVGDKTKNAVSVCGFDKISEKYGVPFFDMQTEKSSLYDCAGMEPVSYTHLCYRLQTYE